MNEEISIGQIRGQWYISYLEGVVDGEELWAVLSGPYPSKEAAEEYWATQGEHNPETCGCTYMGMDMWSCGHVDGQFGECEEMP